MEAEELNVIWMSSSPDAPVVPETGHDVGANVRDAVVCKINDDQQLTYLILNYILF
jgi:hypothetical protein